MLSMFSVDEHIIRIYGLGIVRHVINVLGRASYYQCFHGVHEQNILIYE